MSEGPETIPVCTNCSNQLLAGKPYCAACGLLNGAPPDAASMRDYVDRKIAALIKDQNSIVRELADKAEDVVTARIKRYTVLTGFFIFIILGLLGFIGFRTLGDLKSSVLQQIQPSVNAIQQQAKALGGTLDDLQKNRIPSITQSLNKVQGDANEQGRRISDAHGKFAESMQSLQTAEAKATADSAAFSRSVKENQEKLDQLTQHSQEQINQITQSVSHATIEQAYGYATQEPHIIIGGENASEKLRKPGDKWVNLVYSFDAIHHQSFSRAQLEQIQTALLGAGYRVFLGTVTVGGRFGVGLERMSPDESAVDTEIIYFDKSKLAEAEFLKGLLNKISPTDRAGTLLLEIPKSENIRYAAMKYFGDHSGIDAQIFLGTRSAN